MDSLIEPSSQLGNFQNIAQYCSFVHSIKEVYGLYFKLKKKIIPDQMDKWLKKQFRQEAEG